MVHQLKIPLKKSKMKIQRKGYKLCWCCFRSISRLRHSRKRFSRDPHTSMALASTSLRQYTMIGGSCSYGDRRLVFGSDSKSDIFSRKSDIARAGVMKLRSNDDRLKSTRSRLSCCFDVAVVVLAAADVPSLMGAFMLPSFFLVICSSTILSSLSSFVLACTRSVPFFVNISIDFGCFGDVNWFGAAFVRAFCGDSFLISSRTDTINLPAFMVTSCGLFSTPVASAEPLSLLLSVAVVVVASFDTSDDSFGFWMAVAVYRMIMEID